MSPQLTDTVWMIRPASFYGNPETAATNHFQHVQQIVCAKDKALEEFDRFTKQLVAAGVKVIISQSTDVNAPDALFPNNWIGFFRDGSYVLYPMLALSRRRERAIELPEEIGAAGKVADRSLLDFEEHGKFLEGTGSIVFDHVHRYAFAALSPRTDAEVLEQLCNAKKYKAVPFHAFDRKGNAIYHTNVMMSVGEGFAVVCADAITDVTERDSVLTFLNASGRKVMLISHEQMNAFAGNLLQVKTTEGKRIIVISGVALKSLPGEFVEELKRHGNLLIADIPVIEQLGGGSVRCMLAEIFNPDEC